MDTLLGGNGGSASEGWCKPGLDAATEGEVFGEEAVELWGRQSDAGLDLEDADTGLSGLRKTGASKVLNRQGVGERVIRSDKRG